MLTNMPTEEEMLALLGEERFAAWQQIRLMIDSLYDMETLWNNGGKAWTYEYKYRRGGKTLCALYARQHGLGFMVILGQKERQAFENQRASFSQEIQELYDTTKTYHDGKWLMLEIQDMHLAEDMQTLLRIKRRPNGKSSLSHS